VEERGAVRYYEHTSRKAAWSYKIAIWSLALFIAVLVWHRYFSLPTPLALKLFGGAIALAVVSTVLGAVALVGIWNEGYRGAGRASLGTFLSLLVLAVPLWSLPSLLSLPRLYDVTTDPVTPPAFDRIAKIRQAQANPVHYESSFAGLQAKAYPDIKPLEVQRPLTDVYSYVSETVKSLKWKVIDEQAPEPGRSGRIEAVDRSMIFGFTDDIVIRVTGSQKDAKVDIRSSSRFGQHDLGRNAQRIRLFISDVKNRLAQAERGDRMERVAKARQAERSARPSRAPTTRDAKQRDEGE
jgi:uncharacterized protein (DUF1499 family)